MYFEEIGTFGAHYSAILYRKPRLVLGLSDIGILISRLIIAKLLRYMCTILITRTLWLKFEIIKLKDTFKEN